MIEVQDILGKYFKDFIGEYSASSHHFKTVNALLACRSAALGSHVDTCDNCGHTKVSYNSCRNRHCPKCQYTNSQSWLSNQQAYLLDISYFHVVFTIPDSLNEIVLFNQKSLYSLLFKASSETLLELSKDKKFLGANIGFSSILHTWGQNLSFHPHVHCIVTGGGLDDIGKNFIKSKSNFFIPVKVLSSLFRGKFLFYLKELFQDNALTFPDHILDCDTYFYDLIDSLYSKDWVVFCKPSFDNPNAVLKYLSSYTHRIAISNSRILSMDNGIISFSYKDYRANSNKKIMSLSAIEFIRRFLLHVLPHKFVKVRHYGILSNRNRKKNISICRKILGISSFLYNLLTSSFDDSNSYKHICPVCNIGHMNFSYLIPSVRLLC